MVDRLVDSIKYGDIPPVDFGPDCQVVSRDLRGRTLEYLRRRADGDANLLELCSLIFCAERLSVAHINEVAPPPIDGVPRPPDPDQVDNIVGIEEFEAAVTDVVVAVCKWMCAWHESPTPPLEQNDGFLLWAANNLVRVLEPYDYKISGEEEDNDVIQMPKLVVPSGLYLGDGDPEGPKMRPAGPGQIEVLPESYVRELAATDKALEDVMVERDRTRAKLKREREKNRKLKQTLRKIRRLT